MNLTVGSGIWRKLLNAGPDTQKAILYLAAIFCIVLMAVAAFASPEGAWPLAFAAVFFFALANIERIRSLSASSSGFSIELDRKIEELRDLAKVVSRGLLEVTQRAGRWGGLPHKSKQDILEELRRLAKSSGITDAEFREILEESSWAFLEAYDYLSAILGESIVPAKATEEQIAEWQSLRRAKSLESIDLERMKVFLDQVENFDEERRFLLEALEYYLIHKEHKDISKFEARDKLESLRMKPQTDGNDD